MDSHKKMRKREGWSMTEFREVIYQKDFKTSRHCILAGDIGGTNSNFGIFEMQGVKPLLLFSLHAKSQTITDYASVVADLLRYCKEKYSIMLEEACFGAAGIIRQDRTVVKPTNLTVTMDARAIMQATGLKKLIFINDFEAVALGIDYINPRDLVVINQGLNHSQSQKACIGAGTGMGKSALIWSKHFERYLPIASEGGHADCAAQTAVESKLFEFIQAEPGHQGCPVSWEDLLSGNGIGRIYQFLGKHTSYSETEISREIAAHGFQPDLISAYAQKDARCRATFDLYTTFYARCAKNFVLDLLALDGIYIAGGIAAKNVELFKQKSFLDEFIKCNKHGAILREVPIFVIADYNVSLYGAAAYLYLKQQGIL